MHMCTCVCLCIYPELSILFRGLLKVAEVSSRFGDVRTFLGAVTKLGFKVISKVRAPRSLSVFLSHVWPFRVVVVFRMEVIIRHRCLLLEGMTCGRALGSFLDRDGMWTEVV